MSNHLLKHKLSKIQNDSIAIKKQYQLKMLWLKKNNENKFAVVTFNQNTRLSCATSDTCTIYECEYCFQKQNHAICDICHKVIKSGSNTKIIMHIQKYHSQIFKKMNQQINIPQIKPINKIKMRNSIINILKKSQKPKYILKIYNTQKQQVYGTDNRIKAQIHKTAEIKKCLVFLSKKQSINLLQYIEVFDVSGLLFVYIANYYCESHEWYMSRNKSINLLFNQNNSLAVYNYETNEFIKMKIIKFEGTQLYVTGKMLKHLYDIWITNFGNRSMMSSANSLYKAIYSQTFNLNTNESEWLIKVIFKTTEKNPKKRSFKKIMHILSSLKESELNYLLYYITGNWGVLAFDGTYKVFKHFRLEKKKI